jgi:uncharacterized protein
LSSPKAIHRRPRWALGVLAALSTGLAEPEPLWAASGLRVTTHEVPWPLARRVRVVQLSDLHLGRATDPALLEAAVARVRALEPDLVVMTGDYLNRSLEQAPALRRLVAALPKPCVATLGNHDYWSGADGVRAALRRGGVQVLVNQSRRLSGPGWELTVVGVDDGYTGHQAIRAAFAGLADPRDTLVLTHYPNTADAIARVGGRLIVAGHTHGGHFAVPLLTVALARASGLRYLAGWYTVGKRWGGRSPGSGTRLYVNVGLGAGRVRTRIGERAQPEVAVFDLVPESRPALSAGGRRVRITAP